MYSVTDQSEHANLFYFKQGEADVPIGVPDTDNNVTKAKVCYEM